jgi:hypothetical protein
LKSRNINVGIHHSFQDILYQFLVRFIFQLPRTTMLYRTWQWYHSIINLGWPWNTTVLW